MKAFLSGNEAIAVGAYENGVLFAAGYPGTPSTEILEKIAEYKKIDAQWMSNEKVALDAALGASLAGTRSLVAMKHVGLNVASDTLMTLSYTGVNAGLVIVTADDPGMHSSQNEQDNRNYAKFAKIPLLEPSNSQEAKDDVKLALKISEEFDTPVLIRITTRIAHSRSIVKLSRRRRIFSGGKIFVRHPEKYTMIPINARKRHEFVEHRLKRLKEFSEKTGCNKIGWGKNDIGIIASGVSYQYAKEACPEASFLKLGMSYPLPESLIRKFAKKSSRLYIVEELDPFLEEQIKAMGIKGKGKKVFPLTGELNPDLVREKLCKKNTKKNSGAIARQPFLHPLSFCAGCSYAGLFYILRKLKTVVIGDIGCYALSALPPLSTMDTCVSMGSSIGIALGMGKVSRSSFRKNLIAVIGDSTFIHSGITPLISVVYNKGTTTVIILDNQTTAMTGRQNHPGTGITLKGEKTSKIDYKQLAKALGIKRVKIINCYDLKNIKVVIRQELLSSQPSVLIAKNPCLLLTRRKKFVSFKILDSKCIKCRECLMLGCPAIFLKEHQRPYINSQVCTGCALCKQVCSRNAIKELDIEGK